MSPCINAIQVVEVKEEMQNRIKEQSINLEKFNIDVLNINFNQFFQILLLILFIIGYVISFIYFFYTTLVPPGNFPSGMPLGPFFILIYPLLMSIFFFFFILYRYLDNLVEEEEILPGTILYVINELLYAFFYYVGYVAFILSVTVMPIVTVYLVLKFILDFFKKQFLQNTVSLT